MKKITEYFYIFSKLTSSFVMLLIIFVLIYLIYSSYNNIGVENDNIDKKLSILSKAILENNQDLRKLSNSIIVSESSLKEVKKNLDEVLIKSNSNNDLDIKNIKIVLEKMQIEIKQILSNHKKNTFMNKNEKPNKLSVEVESLIDVIIVRFNNGLEIKNEIIYLDKILPVSKKYIIEKLYLLELKKFYGVDFLSNEFSLSINKYTEDNFKLENKSSIINFILKFVTVKPNNLSTYQNNELNILMSAKNLMENGDIKEALKRILFISDHKIYFSKWIDQANIHIEFMKIIKEAY